ncbi:6,7-dimethyl-8-ribityllumazine synthase [Corynebacterium falsenii]|uniref:6,7-dimethyl-8-ribityllumazine synthase n=1 Tax=Corynebacterium falsenii TaxID=108486 RepID=A0A418Q838_9CORY|nr:6,7-dimethyl-8-ribityllumazine synthase [Corynebacterium falsenii]MDC7103526.1 6,7-dimethyl-8-ribityllumazine synthase [Corynebacterium falsenii]RIX35674.1 6,7-dimethyl-8-ribityllumazine synthase [Corynebacterium falsenii]UBI06128.1 6,7-dimethyl-8-ribityllumazine synthase [Corynebacterium falsenii]HJF12995.1 6,7-dimethyl-8-ribityllumazine synthase [Corynebacterium falsenii]
MAGSGVADIALKPGAAAGMTVAVISATWNADITDQLHERAIATAQEAGAKVEAWRVAGALELPVAVAAACQRFDAVVATGCVIEGETDHFRVVCDAVTYGLTRIALDYDTPVGNGVLTVSTHEQAVDRSGVPGSAEDKGADSATAAIHTALVLRDIQTHDAHWQDNQRGE